MKWEEAINKAINTRKNKPFGRRTPAQRLIGGCTREVYFQGQMIYKEGTHTSDPYITNEVFIEAIKLMGFENKISLDEIKFLKEWTRETQRNLSLCKSGLPGALFHLGWGEPVHPEDAKLGDVLLFFDVHKNSKRKTNTCEGICLGLGKDALKHDVIKYYSTDKIKATQTYARLKHDKDDYTRIFFVCRPYWSVSGEWDCEPYVDPFVDYLKDNDA